MVIFFLLWLPLVQAQNCGDLQDPIAREVVRELHEGSFTCAPNNVHLTFDDGPAASVTPELLRALSSRNIKATFFVSTSRLAATPEATGRMVREILDGGHLLANHGHDHRAHALRLNRDGSVLESGYSQSERDQQIRRSVQLLDDATGGAYSRQRLQFFRFPYGRGAMPSEAELTALERSGEITLSSGSYAERLREYRRISPALQTIAAEGLSHLGWNHDSGDTSYGTDAVEDEDVKTFVKRNIQSLCQRSSSTRVALFHDTKAINVRAIPLIADIGQCLGLDFISAEDMAKEPGRLVENGVLIPQENVQTGMVEQILRTLESASAGASECSEEAPQERRTCFSSQYQRSYAHCTGGNSVCFDGRWFAKSDPFIQQNCKLSH